MTFDAQGRLIVSPQSDQDPMLRITLQDDSLPKVDAFEESKVRHAMGLLYAHDSLYINGHGPQGTGLYRWIDRNQDDQWSDDESSSSRPFEVRVSMAITVFVWVLTA